MRIAVVDGRGGKLGAALVDGIKGRFPDAEIIAVGINATATEQMRKSGAIRCATGENPVLHACRTADLLFGSAELVLADAMVGEVTPKIAYAVATAKAQRILLPFHLDGIQIAGIGEVSTIALIEDALNKAEAWGAAK